MRTYVVRSSRELETVFAEAEDGSEILLAAGEYEAAYLAGRDLERGLRIASLDPEDRAVFTDQFHIIGGSHLLVEDIDVIAGAVAPVSWEFWLRASGVSDSIFRNIKVQGHVPTEEEGADPTADYSEATSAPTRLAGYGHGRGAFFKGENLVIENIDLSDVKWGAAIGGTNVTASRLHIHDVREGVQLMSGENITIENSYFHRFKPWMGPNAQIGDHPDMIQYWGNNRKEGDDFDGITIRGNVFHYEQGVPGQVVFGHMRYSDGGRAMNFDVSDNLIVGNVLRGISLEGVEGARIDGNVLLPSSQLSSDSWLARIVLENTVDAVLTDNVQVRVWPREADENGNVKLSLVDPDRGEFWTDWIARVSGSDDPGALVARVVGLIDQGVDGAEAVSALQAGLGLDAVAPPAVISETQFDGSVDYTLMAGGEAVKVSMAPDFDGGDTLAIAGLTEEALSRIAALDPAGVVTLAGGAALIDATADFALLAQVAGIELAGFDDGATLIIDAALRIGGSGVLKAALVGLDWTPAEPVPAPDGDPSVALPDGDGDGAGGDEADGWAAAFSGAEIDAAIEGADGAASVSLKGDDDAQILTGGGADDLLVGRGGDDALIGGAGRDTLRGDNGADLLIGGADRDTLFGGKGEDVLFGGEGADLFRFEARDMGGTDRLADLSFDEGDGVYLTGFATGLFTAARGGALQVWPDGSAALIDSVEDLALLAGIDGIALSARGDGAMLSIDGKLTGRADAAMFFEQVSLDDALML